VCILQKIAGECVVEECIVKDEISICSGKNISFQLHFRFNLLSCARVKSVKLTGLVNFGRYMDPNVTASVVARVDGQHAGVNTVTNVSQRTSFMRR